MTEENRRKVWRYNQSEDEEATAEATASQNAQAGSGSVAAGEGTDAQRQYARWFAEHIDEIWDQPPADGKANLRVLMRKEGRPFAGKVSLQTEFSFIARGGRGAYLTQGLNPNSKGRWVYEELEPGTYNLLMTGTGRFDGWSWSKDGVTVAAGDTPLFELDLDE